MKIFPRLDLEPRQDSYYFAIDGHGFRRDQFTFPMLGKKFEKRGVTEILFEIRPGIQILGKNVRNRQSVSVKMPRKREKRRVLFTNAIQNADRAGLVICQANNPAPGAAKVPLHRLHTLRRRVKILLEKFVQYVHGLDSNRFRLSRSIDFLAFSRIADSRPINGLVKPAVVLGISPPRAGQLQLSSNAFAAQLSSPTRQPG